MQQPIQLEYFVNRIQVDLSLLKSRYITCGSLQLGQDDRPPAAVVGSFSSKGLRDQAQMPRILSSPVLLPFLYIAFYVISIPGSECTHFELDALYQHALVNPSVSS